MRAEAALKRAGKGKPELSESERKSLELLKQAFTADATIRGKLAQKGKNGKTEAEFDKEITDLTNQLEAVLDQAEAESSLDRFDAFKKAIGRGAL